MMSLRLLFIVLVSFFVMGGTYAQAAELYFGAPAQEVGVSKYFEVGVFLSTEGEGINAAGGEILLPQEVLEFREVRDGASVVSFWVERPSLQGETLSFSGIIPGGYSGAQGFLFSFVVRARELGKITISARGVEVLRNDGTGTSVPVRVAPLVLQVVERSGTPEFASLPDPEPPEAFIPEIARDPKLFNGQWFLVFTTQDKGSGIDRYEVREGSRPFMAAQSPYLLQHQDLDEEIAVRVVDRHGNERVAVLPPQTPRQKYGNLSLWGILILAIGIGYVIMIWRKTWRKV